MTIESTTNEVLTPAVLEELALAFEEAVGGFVDYLPVVAVKAIAAGAIEKVLNHIDYPYTQLPGIVRTEWGIKSEFGTEAVIGGDAQARKIAENMVKAGHNCTAIWRGVTDWQEQ